MNNFPRQQLRRITTKYGKEICSDARRCEGLLNDLCGAYRREINVLVSAVEERIPLDLLAGAGSVPYESLLGRLEKQFEDQTAMNAEAARWAVESWALALGVVTDSEIEQRTDRHAQPSVKPQSIHPTESKNESADQTVSNVDSHQSNSQLPSKAPIPPLRPTQPNKQTSQTPTVYVPANSSPTVLTGTTNTPVQSSNQGAVSKSRSGIFRGCLIIVFLLTIASIVLLFGVPYAVEVMRETQREKNNEPPRLPGH